MTECSRVVDAPACTRDTHRTTHTPGISQTEFSGQRLRVTSSVEQQVVQVWFRISFAEEQAGGVWQLVFEGLRRRETGQTDEYRTGQHHVLRLHRRRDLMLVRSSDLLLMECVREFYDQLKYNSLCH